MSVDFIPIRDADLSWDFFPGGILPFATSAVGHNTRLRRRYKI